jgi:hypothetical protein
LLVVGALSGCSGETIDAGANAPDSGSAAEGGGGVTLASGIQLPPTHLLSDGTTLFWTDEGGALWSMPVGGGRVTSLAPMIPAVPVTLLAVDGANYYVELGDLGIYRISKGASPTTLISDPANTVAGTTMVTSGPATILGGTAYWSEQTVVDDGGPWQWLLKSVSLQGGPITLVAQLAPDGPAVSAIGVTSSTAFFVGASATLVEQAPLSTGTSTGIMFASGCGTLVSDTDAVYCYLRGTVGPIQRIQSDGETMSLGTMIDMSAAPSVALAVDDTDVYWVDDTTLGTVMKVSKAGFMGVGPTATVIAHDTSPIAIAVDATSVYWSNAGGEIRRAPK